MLRIRCRLSGPYSAKSRHSCNVGFWQILLQKSAVTDDVVRPFHLGRRGLDPDADALYATFTLRNTQSLSGWRSRNQRCEPP